MTEEIVTQKNSQTSPVKPKIDLGEIENILINGDIGAMNEIERIEYVKAICRSIGLNPLTRPFGYISFQGKTILYAKKDCTDQLRNIYGISTKISHREVIEGIFTVTVMAKNDEGREDEDLGCVNVQGLKGDALANAYMKCVTKAKRRVTLAICGLGILDESETETLAGAKPLKDFDQPKADPAEKKSAIAPPAITPTVAESKAGVISDRPSESQMRRLWAIAASARVSEAEIHKYIEKHFRKLSLRDINFTEYKEICDGWLPTVKADMQAKAVAKAVEAVSPKGPDDFDSFPPMEEPPEWVK